MKQLQFREKIDLRPREKAASAQTVSGDFCPLPQAKGGGLLKGGAVTSAFMSAFL